MATVKHTGKKTVTAQKKAPKKGMPRWFFPVIALLAFILYANTLSNGYVLDDKGIITGNKFTTRGFSGIPDLLTTSYWEGVGINVRSYRPLAPVTFAAEVGFFGTSPAVSHFFNLVIYMITGMVLLLFLKRLTGLTDPGIPDLVPFLVTLLFLAHPIHTEAVANIKGRDSMFELLFLLLSGYYLLKYISTHSRKDLVFSVVAFFPALLSKESAIAYIAMVPVMLLLFDRSSLAAKAKTTAWYLLPAVLFLVLYYNFSNVRAFLQLHLLDNALTADAPAAQIWATKILILGKYLWLLIFPHPLLYDYSYNQIPLTGFSDPRVWISLIIYLVATGSLLYILFRVVAGRTVGAGNRIIAFSVAWFIMGFFASSNLVMLIGSTMGERFMYSPSLGFLLLVVYGLYLLSKKIPDRGKKASKTGPVALTLVCMILLAGYTFKTIDRNKAWKDDFTLFSTDIVYLGQNAKANDFLGNVYSQKGDRTDDAALKKEAYLKAISYKEKAAELCPSVHEIRQQLAFLYGNTGQFQQAIGSYKTAISLNPGEVNNYIQIGKAYGMIGMPAQGLVYLLQGEKINPRNTELLTTLGISQAQTGETDKAIACFEKVLAIDPSDTRTARYLALTKRQLARQKR